MKGYWIKHVDVYENSAPDDVDVPFRLIKKKGEIGALSAGPIGYLAHIHFKKGITRGNHYHQKKEEYFYIISGKYNFHIRHHSKGGGDVVVHHVEAGNLIAIQPGWSHAFEVLESGDAIEFSPQPFKEIRKDSIRDYLIEK